MHTPQKLRITRSRTLSFSFVSRVKSSAFRILYPFKNLALQTYPLLEGQTTDARPAATCRGFSVGIIKRMACCRRTPPQNVTAVMRDKAARPGPSLSFSACRIQRGKEGNSSRRCRISVMSPLGEGKKKFDRLCECHIPLLLALVGKSRNLSAPLHAYSTNHSAALASVLFIAMAWREG